MRSAHIALLFCILVPLLTAAKEQGETPAETSPAEKPETTRSPNADTDNDGVPNERDVCPDAPGQPEAGGCPREDRNAELWLGHLMRPVIFRAGETKFVSTERLEATIVTLTDIAATPVEPRARRWFIVVYTAVAEYEQTSRLELHRKEVPKDSVVRVLAECRAQALRNALLPHLPPWLVERTAFLLSHPALGRISLFKKRKRARGALKKEGRRRRTRSVYGKGVSRDLLCLAAVKHAPFLHARTHHAHDRHVGHNSPNPPHPATSPRKRLTRALNIQMKA